MKRYITTGIITVPDGVISISEAQASRRLGRLEEIKKGIYKIVSQVQFKVGEEIGFEKTPKAFMRNLKLKEKRKADV